MRPRIAVAAAVLAAGCVGQADADIAEAPPCVPAALALHCTVGGADTWLSIAQAHGVPTDALKAAQLPTGNNVPSDSSHPRTGSILHVPEVSTTTSPPTSTTSTVAPTTTSATSTSTTTVAPSTTTTTTAPPVTPSTTSPPPAPTSTPSSSASPTTSAPSTTPPPGVAFSEDFTSPTSFAERFVHHVGNACSADQTCRPENDPLNPIHEFTGDHDRACNGPDTTRTIDVANREDFFWHCAPGGAATGHLMTGYNTGGYAVVSFAVGRPFTNVARVCWDINLTDESGGRWANMVLVDEALYQRFAPRLDYVAPEFNDPGGPGDFNIQAGDHGGAGDIFGLKSFRGQLEVYRDASILWANGSFFPEFQAITDKATRYQHCVERVPGGTRITQQTPFGPRVYTAPASMPTGTVRVLFQDEMYDPPKRDGYAPNKVTWHFDNILVETS